MARKTATGAARSPCTRGLTEALPYHRLFNSPISEAAIVGTAVGYALEGGRPSSS
jgi:pyruvate/2-oxoglutarate/acetoin dehydrogenase E1 component